MRTGRPEAPWPTAALLVAAWMVSCGGRGSDQATGTVGGGLQKSKTPPAKKNVRALDLPVCAYPKGHGDCWTKRQVPDPFWHASEDVWGEVNESSIGMMTRLPSTYRASYVRTWQGRRLPTAVTVETRPYLTVDVQCGRDEWSGIDTDVEFRYDRLGVSGKHSTVEWIKIESQFAERFGRFFTPTWSGKEVHLVLPASQAVYHAALRLFLPAGTDLALRGVEQTDHVESDHREIVDKPGVAQVNVWGHCGQVDVSGPGNALLLLAGQVDALKVDLPKGAVNAWLEPGTPSSAPIEIHAKAAIVNLPDGQHLAGPVPSGWSTGFVGAVAVQDTRGSGVEPSNDDAHPATLDAPRGLVRWIHWGRVEDITKAGEGPAWSLDQAWAVSFATEGTGRNVPLPPPGCTDMLAPDCDEFAGRGH